MRKTRILSCEVKHATRGGPVIPTSTLKKRKNVKFFLNHTRI